jgi:hypothetical protein
LPFLPRLETLFIHPLEAAGLTVEPRPGDYRALARRKPLGEANTIPITLPFFALHDPLRRAAVIGLRKLGVDLKHEGQ